MRSMPSFRMQSGFSLIEILIVAALMVTIIAVVASQTFRGSDRANVNIAKTQLESLAKATASSMVLFIFQFPATIFFLIKGSSLY